MSVAMTSRDRVARAFARRDHDRVPRFDQFWPETITRWKTEGLAGNPAERFGFDMVTIADIEICPHPGRREVLSEDAESVVVRDEWGATVRHRKDKTGSPEYLAWECTGPDTWRDLCKRPLAAGHFPLDVPAIRQIYDQARKDHQWTCLVSILGFEALKMLMGQEQMLMAMVDEPQLVSEISHTYTNKLIEVLERLLNAGLRFDALWIFEEMASQKGPLCGPSHYRTLIWPDHRRLVDWAHQRGLKVILHSDGQIESYLEMFILAGIDCVHPLEAKAGLDLRQLGPKYGRRLSLFGNIDMTVAGTNDRAKIEAEMQAKLEAGKATKGYLYHSDHSVPPEVSWATYQFMMELLNRHGMY